MHRPLLALLLLTTTICGWARATDGESCLPGSSCWASLQSIEALGSGTADIAREVERLAARDPELMVLATRMGAMQTAVQRLTVDLHKYQQLDWSVVKPALDSMKRELRRLRGEGTRYLHYHAVIDDLEQVVLDLDRLRDQKILPSELALTMQRIASALGDATNALLNAKPDTRDPEDHSAEAGRPAPKIQVHERLSDVYGDKAGLRFAIMAVPDPRIPRYRRSFDLNLAALHRAMAAHGAYFDRYHFPWKSDQKTVDHGRVEEKIAECRRANETNPSRKPSAERSAACEALEHQKRLQAPVKRGDVGLVTYRIDCWRGRTVSEKLCESVSAASGPTASTAIFGIYLIAERGSDGPDAHGLQSALRWVAFQQDCPPANRRSGDQGVVPAGCTPAEIQPAAKVIPKEIVVLGPLNSSALDPLARTVESWLISERELWSSRNLSYLSPIATADDNRRLFLGRTNHCALSRDPFDGSKAAPKEASWMPMAPCDSERMAKLSQRLSAARRIPQGMGECVLWRSTLILSENTVYGGGIKLPSDSNACEKEVQRIEFTPRIWETRIGQGTARERVAGGSAPDLPRWQRRFARELRLDADKGDEYPPYYSEEVTARTLELEIERVLERTRDMETIIIVASDIRDQLLLAREVRRLNSDALLVFLEADSLLAHPDYIDATRGSLVVPLTNLTQRGPNDSRHDFAKDEAAMVFRTVTHWLSGGQLPANDDAPLMVVGRNGLQVLSGTSSNHNSQPPDAHGASRAETSSGKAEPRRRPAWIGLLLLTGLLIGLQARAGFRSDAVAPSRPPLPRSWFGGKLAFPIWLWVVAAIGVALMLGTTSNVLTADPHPWINSDGLDHVFALTAAAIGLILVGLLLIVRMMPVRSACRVAGFRLGGLRSRDLSPWEAPVAAVAVIVVAVWLLCADRVHTRARGYVLAWQQSAPTGAWLSWLLLALALAALALLTVALVDWWRLRRLTAACSVGADLALAQRWVGHPRLLSAMTPFMAMPDAPVLPWQDQAPELAPIRRRRQLLALQMLKLRWGLLLAAVLSALGIAAIYACPVANQTLLLKMFLLVGIGAAVLMMVAVVGSQRDPFLSAIFGGSDSSGLFTWKVLSLVLVPILVIVVLVAMSLQPGVRDWADGVLLPLWSWFNR